MKLPRPTAAILFLSVLALAGVTSTAPADAASSFRTEGVTIRLLAETPDASGQLRGVVVLDLEPGWKTYWLDPGASGLAPMLDFSGSEGITPPTLAFPPPERFHEGDSAFNGYDEPMAIAFQTTTAVDVAPRLSLALAVGICSDICVPVTAELERDLSEQPSLDEAMAIDRAFIALPRDRPGVEAARIEGEDLVLSKLSDERAAKDLFVSGPAAWSFGPAQSDGATWRVPIRSRPKGVQPPISLDAVVIEGNGARRFAIDIP